MFETSAKRLQICVPLNVNEIHFPYDKHHKVSSMARSHQNKHNSVKYKVIWKCQITLPNIKCYSNYTILDFNPGYYKWFPGLKIIWLSSPPLDKQVPDLALPRARLSLFYLVGRQLAWAMSIRQLRMKYCAHPENTHTPLTEGIGISWGGEGFCKTQILKKCVKLY